MKNRRLITRIECEMRRRAEDLKPKSMVQEHRDSMAFLDLYRVRSIIQADYIKELEKELATIKLNKRYKE